MPDKIHILTRDLLDVLHGMTFFISAEGAILETNVEAIKTLGAPKEQILSELFTTYLKDAFKEHFRIAHEVCIQTGKEHEFEVEMKNAHGGHFDALIQLSRYPANATPEKCLTFIYARDIGGERKKDMDLLRFANVAHYTVNPLEITDIDGKIVYVNPAFEKVSGYTKDELIGKNPSFFGSGKHTKSFWQKVWATIIKGEVWTGEIENRRRNGEPFHTLLLISPIVNDKGQIMGYFGVHRDISEQRFLEQKLVQAQKMESIGLLAAGIAHEVGNPLASISSLAQVIQRTTQDENTRSKLELIKNQVTRISRIIRDLVDFSRRSTHMVIDTDVNKVVSEALEIVRVGKKAKSVQFNVTLDAAMPKLPLVPDQIQQVFINILINAVDAVFTDFPPDVIPSKTRNISITSFTKAGSVNVTISDTGKGIPEDDIPKVFEPFFTTKKVGEGTGLGLWVSYSIVKSFHGNIFVDSKREQGTTFTVTLPINQELL